MSKTYSFAGMQSVATDTRAKGDHFERHTLQWLKRNGWLARPTYSSGQLRRNWSDYGADIDLGWVNPDSCYPVWQWKGEVKARESAHGWQRLTDWLGSNDVLVLGTGYVLLSAHGFLELRSGCPSPITAREGASTKTLEAYLEHADVAFLWGPGDRTPLAFLAWETMIDILTREDRWGS